MHGSQIKFPLGLQNAFILYRIERQRTRMSTSSTIALKRRIQERAGTSLASWSTNSHNIMRNLKGSRSNFIKQEKGTQVLLFWQIVKVPINQIFTLQPYILDSRGYFSFMTTRYV